MREVNKKNWHIITNEVVKIEEDVFVPYFYKGELGCSKNSDAALALLKMIPSGKNLFIHHALSGHTFNNISTNELNEIVLPKTKLTKKFENIFCGHIHVPSRDLKNNIIYTGSVFTNEVNEIEKFIYRMDDNGIGAVKLPVRPIVKLENPTMDDLIEFPDNSIVKVILTKKYTEEGLASFKKKLREGFDGYILIEDYKTERKIIKFADGDLDLNIDNLLTIYSKERKVDAEKLFAGWNLIK